VVVHRDVGDEVGAASTSTTLDRPHSPHFSRRPTALVPDNQVEALGTLSRALAALRRSPTSEGGARHVVRITSAAQPIPSIIHRGAGETMVDQAARRNVEVSDRDRVVAPAQVTTSPHVASTARRRCSRHQAIYPIGSRGSLVDAVLDLPELQGNNHLEATVPLGDSESL
jgi:hypothetical protein